MASGLWRVFHWGPLVAIGKVCQVTEKYLIFTTTTGIIKWVTLATLYCTSMLWPPAQSAWGLFFTSLFSCFSSLTLYHFTSALSQGPGFLPLNWAPVNLQARSQLQFCSQCEGFKAPRSHHCRRCNRCVMKMDHHCPWINTCVGHYNHGEVFTLLIHPIELVI